MPDLRGRAVIYGAPGTIDIEGAGVVGSANRSLEYGHNYDLKVITDSVGEAQTLVGSNEAEELAIEFVPSGDSLADAQAFAEAGSKPTILAKVTLTDFALDTVNGDWSYAGGARGRFTNDDVYVITLPLRRFPAGLTDPVA